MSDTRSRGESNSREILVALIVAGLSSAALTLLHAEVVVAAVACAVLTGGALAAVRRRARLEPEPEPAAAPVTTTTGASPELFSQTSHQLRTPLSIARGHAEILRTAVIGTADEIHVGIILQELDRVARLSERMLVLAAADDANFLVPVETSIDRIVIEAAQRWQPTAERRWEIDCNDDTTIVSDATRVMMAIDALVENAVFHTQEGDDITISGRARKGMAEIMVADTGRGMSPTDVEALLAAVRAGQAGGPRRPGGTGLGLRIASAIVEAHGGRMTIASDAGEGSTFTLLIPLRRPGADVLGFFPQTFRAS